jgi:flavin-dependent dehydrogenase
MSNLYFISELSVNERDTKLIPASRYFGFYGFWWLYWRRDNYSKVGLVFHKLGKSQLSGNEPAVRRVYATGEISGETAEIGG